MAEELEIGRPDSQRRNARNDDSSMFGDIRERRVTFCIDTSASMYDCLDMLKSQLIAVLEQRARRPRDGDAFNVVEFSSSVVQWADEMVALTTATVSEAAKWIRGLQPRTGTNTGDAVVAALSDAGCEAVCLVTDSLPDQSPEDVVDAILRAADKRPVHCRYIQRRVADSSVVAFLRDIATETLGSLLVATVSSHGNPIDVVIIHRADPVIRTTTGGIFPRGHKVCSVGTSLNELAPAVTAVVSPPWPYCLYPWPYRYYYTLLDNGGMRWRAGKAWMKHTREVSDGIVTAAVPGAGAMLVGQQVLARRHSDGFFYMGTVRSQVRLCLFKRVGG